MPVELRELTIKAEVLEQSGQQSVSQGSQPMSAAEKEKLVKTCIDRVFEVLKRSNQK